VFSCSAATVPHRRRSDPLACAGRSEPGRARWSLHALPPRPADTTDPAVAAKLIDPIAAEVGPPEV